MKRYSLSISSLRSLSEEDDFEYEYDTLQELNAMLEELINDSIAEGLYLDKNDYLKHNSVHAFDMKRNISLTERR